MEDKSGQLYSETKRRPPRPSCRYGVRCTNSLCTWNHDGLELKPLCMNGSDCTLFFTDRSHKSDYRHPWYDMRCINEPCTNMNCSYKHPNGRLPMCNNPYECVDFACGMSEARYEGAFARCPKQHSYDFKMCRYRTRCKNRNCSYSHPPECINGYNCKYKRGRPMCVNVNSCSNTGCIYWHAGDNTEDLKCCYDHAGGSSATRRSPRPLRSGWM